MKVSGQRFASATIVSVAAALLALTGAGEANTQARETRRADSSARVTLVAKAGESLGSAAARASGGRFRAEQAGTYFAGEQSRSPALPIAEAGRVYRWRFDPGQGVAIREAEQHFPGGIAFWSRAGVTPDGGWIVDLQRWRTGTDLEQVDSALALRDRLQWERFFPHLLVRQAEFAQTTEALSASRFRYVDAAGAAVDVEVDPRSGRPIKAVFPAPAGPPLELSYLDYRRWQGVLLPRRVQVRQGDRLVEDIRLANVEVDQLRQADLAPPTGYSPPPAAGEPRLRLLASRVFLFENMPGDYHSMALDMGDHLVLLEAPLSPTYAELQRRLLEQTFPGKRVRSVLVTHHHGDHTGGLASWAQAGATIIAASGTGVALERQMRARGYQGALNFEEVSERRSIGAGPGRLDAYAFASSHAESHLLIHVPSAQILFQGDMFYLPARGGPPPAFIISDELEQQIAGRGLRVRQIVGVHGRPATTAEFRRSLELGRAAPAQRRERS